MGTVVEDDRSLYDGILHLATSYFDTTSQFNKHHQKKKPHFSFQSVKGKDWKDAVKDILQDTQIGELFGESGKTILKRSVKTGLTLAVEGASGEGLAMMVVGALTDAVSRIESDDGFLVNEDKNPNSNGCRLTGFCNTELGIHIPKIADGIAAGTIKTLLVFGEDVTQHGISAALLGQVENLIVCDLLPNETTQRAKYLLPGAAVVEKRGSMISAKGRLQKFMKAIEGPGESRAEWEFLYELVHKVTGNNGYSTIEGLFNQMAQDTPAFEGLEWAKVGDMGVEVEI